MKIGQITLKSSYKPLENGFNWAKEQALSFIHEGDPVGLWYEAALPNREAFCIRDIAHQCNGAFFLGLKDFSKNMLRKFAQNISEGKDFCTFWEINKNNLPAPVDYRNDQDFWYNLPANFDLLDCCLRQYNWTGDLDYITDESFKNFYNLSVNDYVLRWDKDGDGILEKQGSVHYRGIPSYMEGHVKENGIYVGSDLIAAMFAGYRAYSTILQIQGNSLQSLIMEERATLLRDKFNREWWSTKDEMFYSAILQDGTKTIVDKDNVSGTSRELTPKPLYFDIIHDISRKKMFLKLFNECETLNVENLSILPDIFYKHGDPKSGFDVLMQLVDTELKRREYPEVSFSVIGNILTGVLGLSAEAHKGKVKIKPAIPEFIDWIEINDIPLLDGSINITINKNKMTIERNKGESFILETILNGQTEIIKVETGHLNTVKL